MDIGGWLRGLGLGQYEAAFRDNSIGADVLPDLTESDLGQLGVTLGDRKRLLRAIASLSATEPAKPTSPASTPSSTEAAERRPLTVMFCDLVGSTAMSARLDPEDMRGIIGAYHGCCATLIVSNGGFVAKYMGDGVLAYFGYPQAHEDDAERAVQAGLAIVEAAPKLETAADSPLQVRIGIATGIVVVGDLLGSGEAQERGIVGDTPNLAARLQGIAEPNSVVIAEGTRKLLGNLFELEDLGPRNLKGIAESVRTWVALRANPSESRFEALHATGLTALVGREEEFELLLRRWSRAKGGEGQVVLLSGEAGIGKSRLTAAFLDRLADDSYTRLRYFCSPQHTDSALRPIIGQLERAAALARDDTPGTKLDKLDALLARSFTSRENAALFAEMLSLPNDGRYPTPELAPQQRRQQSSEALISQIGALALNNPVLMILEDAHWADPTSLEVFGRLVDRIQTLRVLLFVTYRPEFAPPWVGYPHVTPLTVNRLTQREVIALIDHVLGNKQLPPNIKKDIVERADGIPLFVEEMTKAVLEAEGEGAASRAIAALPSPALAVPASLHASLMARLDRLGQAREIAQIGAAIGREFSFALLASVARKPEAELESALDRLIQAGLLFRQSAAPHATYLFKHALVQDAAYGTLLREPRRALHARIAETLETQFADIVESQPELLARHCTAAGNLEKAAGLWGKAGQRSRERSAMVEAVEQFTSALTQIAALPTAPALRREEIELQAAVIAPLMNVKGYAAPETKAAINRALLLIKQAEELGEPPEDSLLLLTLLHGSWTTSFMEINGDKMRNLATEFQEVAQKVGATFPIMVGHRISGISLLFTGHILEGVAYLDRSIALYDPVEHRRRAMQTGGQDALVENLGWRSVALWLLGYPDAALMDAENALKYAREIGQAATLMHALSVIPLTQINCGDYAAAKAEADELVQLSGKTGSLSRRAFGILWQGWLLALTDKASDALQVMTDGLVAFRSTGSTAWMPLYLSNLARVYARLDQFDEAWRCIEEAAEAIQATGERWNEAEVHRTAGEIALMSSEPKVTKAEEYFARALKIARAQQARSWELRAATSMARLWRDQGTRQQGRDLLAPVYRWFTEGFDTLDLKEAKALLDELAL